MKRILHMISSLNGNASNSLQLSEAIIEKLTTTYPESKLVTHDLAKAPFPHLDATHVASFQTPEESRTAAQKEAAAPSEEAIKELMESDIIVIGVPLYNFAIPSALKAWIDHIARAGVTFSYAGGAPEGLVKNKKVYLAIAAGAVYSDGPFKAYDFTEPYLRAVLGFMGMTDITTFRVEGVMMPGAKETAVPHALDRVAAYAF
jgi:FMN-dependent NADH-azoreductase